MSSYGYSLQSKPKTGGSQLNLNYAVAPPTTPNPKYQTPSSYLGKGTQPQTTNPFPNGGRPVVIDDPNPGDILIGPKPGQPGSPGGPPGDTSTSNTDRGGNRNTFYDWENDPFLLETLAQTARSRAAAEAQRNDALRKYILGAGIGGMAEKLFPGDTAFAQSVLANPFSGMGNIRNTYEGVGGKVNQLNEQLNTDNLFFGSYRTGTALPEVFRQRQGEEYTLGNQLQTSIDTVNASYASTLEQLQQRELDAKRQAWLDAMQAGAISGGGPGSGSTGSGDNGAGLVGRPGEYAGGATVIEGWDPSRNSDARYDMSDATKVPGGYVRNGVNFDADGKVR